MFSNDYNIFCFKFFKKNLLERHSYTDKHLAYRIFLIFSDLIRELSSQKLLFKILVF